MVSNGKITVNQSHILSVSTDPSSGGGVTAPVGSLAMAVDNGSIWKKTGAGDTAWTEITAGGGGTVTSVATGTGLTGGPIVAAGTVDLDFNALATVTATAADYVSIVDVTSGNQERKALISDIVALTPAGSLILLATATAANSATIDFTSGINSTYDQYLITLTDVVPVTGSTIFWMRASEDGGATYLAAVNSYAWDVTQIALNGANTADADTADNELQLTGNEGVLTTGLNGWIRLYSPAGAGHKFVKWEIGYDGAGAADFIAEGYGQVNGTTAITPYNAVRFLFSGNNISSGTFALYGIKKT